MGHHSEGQKLGLEFTEKEYWEIDEYCKNVGISWFASSWDLNSQNFLRKFDCSFNKIASAMLVFTELLEMVADEGNILLFQLE